MVFSVPTLLAYISQAMTLEPGDVVLTGTPEGVGPLAEGDAVTIALAGVGELRLRCASGKRDPRGREGRHKVEALLAE